MTLAFPTPPMRYPLMVLVPSRIIEAPHGYRAKYRDVCDPDETQVDIPFMKCTRTFYMNI